MAMTQRKHYTDMRKTLCQGLDRFAAVAPLVARRSSSQAEITTKTARLVSLLDLALDGADAVFEVKELEFLTYTIGRIHMLLDQAEVAAAFSGDSDGAFDERHFAGNLAAAELCALHGAARILAFDTDGLRKTDIAASFHAFDGVSAGFGPTLLERIKALIVAILSYLARKGVIKAGQVQRVIDILARIDELLGQEVLFLAPPLATKAFVTLEAGENLSKTVTVPAGKTAVFRRVAFDDEGGRDEFVEVRVSGALRGTLRTGSDSVSVPGPANVTLQFTTQNVGVDAVVCVLFI